MCLVVPLVSSDTVFDCDHSSYRLFLLSKRLWRTVSPAYCFTSCCLTKEADNDRLGSFLVLTGSESADKGVIERQTNQSDLDGWVEVPFRLGRERSCGQDVCETGVCGFVLGRLRASV